MTRGIERTFSRPFSETFRISKNEDFNGPYLENKNEFLKNSFETVFRASKFCDRGQLVSAFQLTFNRLEKFAADRGYFSELQFGFREGVGCIEASFTILETINHMLERGSKVFSCFLDVRKAFDTVWIDGLLYKLFNDLSIKGRMWLPIKDLYTDVKAQALYSGELSREFDVSQGTGQGRIFAPFMYKVYINSLLYKLSNHCYVISINSLSLPAPSFADDVTLLALFPSFLKTVLNICHQYSVTWRYEFNHTKSGVVTFCETKPIHSRLMKEREWTLGDTKVDELYEYKILAF